VESYARSYGDAGRAWIAGLPALAEESLDRWALKRDGTAGAGEAALVLPVVRQDGTRAVLKLQMPREETAAALTGLRTWNGAGVVRLLGHDPHGGTLLLERVDASRTLSSIEDDDVANGVTMDGILPCRAHDYGPIDMSSPAQPAEPSACGAWVDCGWIPG
jgi:streptomycin 6-kinase